MWRTLLIRVANGKLLLQMVCQPCEDATANAAADEEAAEEVFAEGALEAELARLRALLEGKPSAHSETSTQTPTAAQLEGLGPPLSSSSTPLSCNSHSSANRRSHARRQDLRGRHALAGLCLRSAL